MNQLYQERLSRLKDNLNNELGNQIGRGVEREALRIETNGQLAKRSHPRSVLGSNLTHPLITTDYAENLLEFITPVSRNHQQLIAQLKDIHHFVLSSLDNELLWPMSMPCFLEKEDDIQLAQYGHSNIGRMKTLYRQGLKNRYGSKMQVIAGLHYNFSLPETFWPVWQQQLGDTQPLQQFISEQYMGLVRNFYRYGWVIPYWFGASPALCRSFLKEGTSLNFEEVGMGTRYLPYATSLRMSDLGYTSNAQSTLNISYNSLSEYVQSVRQATQTHSPEFEKIGIKVDGQYRQLNANILQIENELYAPIRVKRVTKSGQTPSQALAEKGVEYIEVRSLDINPFVPEGVKAEQLQFIDALLMWCLMLPSEPFAPGELQMCRENLGQIAKQGRDPALSLTIGDTTQLVSQWLEQIMDGLADSAQVLGKEFEAVIHKTRQQIPLSEQLLSQLVADDIDNGTFAKELADAHRQSILEHQFTYWQKDDFVQMTQQSLQKQAAIEEADSMSLDDYLSQYFAKAQAPFAE
ncbi:glutamate--cysteine ligase [Celerinatantimonas sp. YJH-8]|uniref:glutamate--cysteine ligase n=1 Tax=Celerinatantimonas sp. YJH-8 TaxID=3228714 RepID=UPI0038BEDD72